MQPYHVSYHCIAQFKGTLLVQIVDRIKCSHLNISEQIFPDWSLKGGSPKNKKNTNVILTYNLQISVKTLVTFLLLQALVISVFKNSATARTKITGRAYIVNYVIRNNIFW